MVVALKEGLLKFPQGVFMLWYPLKNFDQQQGFYDQLSAMKLTNALKTEFYFYKAPVDGRLNGSGMVIVNLPWGLEDEMRSVFAELNTVLAFEPAAPWSIEALSENLS